MAKKTLAIARPSRRLLAFMVDLIILEVIIFWPFEGTITFEDLFANETTTLIIGLIMGLIATLYFSLFEWMSQATPGKMLFRLRTQEHYTYPQCLVRHLYMVPVFPLTLLWIIEPIMLLTKKRRLCEIISHTDTIEVRP